VIEAKAVPIRAPSLADAGPAVAHIVRDEYGVIVIRETLDALLAAPPGPWMATIVALFAALPRAEVSTDERIDMLGLLERCESWISAQKQLVFAELRRDAGVPSPRSDEPGYFEDTLLETSLALRWSEWMVFNRMETGREICDRLPDTWQALAEGRINYQQAHKIAEATQKIDDDEKAARLEKRVLARAPRLTRADTSRLVDRELIKADPEGAEKRRKNARSFRKVSRSRDEDGMATLHAHGPAEDIAVIDIVLSRGADLLKATGQVESMDEGRFDTLVSWATDYLRQQFVPSKSARPVALGLVVKKSTVDGHDDDPGWLDRWGPVTAQVARDLVNGTPPRPGPFWPGFTPDERAGMGRRDNQLFADDEEFANGDPDPPPPDPDWDTDPPDDWDPVDGNAPPDDEPPSPSPSPPTALRILHVDPETGWLMPPPGVRVDFGLEKRFFTGAARQFVLDRFRVCEFPGCAMPARCCDADHWKEHAKGGPTDATTNAAPGCPHHNRRTHNREGWDIEPNGDGTATLVTPLRRRYPITPFNYLDI
jgi:hypothetical protein